MKIKSIGIGLVLFFLFTAATSSTFFIDPTLPATPYDYSVNVPAHFLTPSGPNATSVVSFDNIPAANPITNDGATLGRVLFYDTNLSSNRVVACASCHKQNAGFSDPSVLSSGFAGGFTRRHSMTLINSRYYQRGRFFWDERAATLEAQVLQPFQDPVEMGLTLATLTQRISEQPYYATLFANAFGDNTVTTDRVSKALSQFVRSIVSYSSKYDIGRVQVNTQNLNFPNFTAQENQGKQLFLAPIANGGGSCIACHTSESFNAPPPGPENNGIDAISTTDLGAFEALPQTAIFRGRFKTSTLRNIELTAPYMHDGRFQTLEQVVEHYNSGIQAHPTLSNALKDINGNPVRLNFTTAQKAALVAFLKTLTDNSIATEAKWSNPFPSPQIPIELLTFLAKPLDNKVQLDWQTATEIGNAFFTIEKSIDGEKWASIGTQKGAGNSSQKQIYTFFDTNPTKGIQYYRLKQTDFDSRSTYSKVVSAYCKTAVLASISLFPNPTKGQVTINLNDSALENGAHIQVLNTIGQVVFEHKYATGRSLTIDMSNLTNGQYFVKATIKDGSQTLNIMKN
jgi:cytochrome c peroxidase